MADLQTAIFTILSWFLYVGITLSAGAVIVSIGLFAYGNKPLARKLFISGLAGLLIGASFSQIYSALVSGLSPTPPADIIGLAVVACLLVCSVLYFGLGRGEEGVNYAIAAVLAAGFIALIPGVQALFGSNTINLAGTCMLDADMSPFNPSVGEEVTVTVKMAYGSGSYTLTADFGDNTTASTGISSGGTATLKHSYSKPGTYAILLTAKGNGTCYITLGVNVGEPPAPWFIGFFDMSGFLSGVNSLLKLPLNLFYAAPEFDLNQSSEDMKLYMAVTSVAVTALGLFLVLRIVSGFLDKDPSSSTVDAIKEAVLVLAVILIAPYLYQTFAFLCNQVTSLVVDKINLAPMLASLTVMVIGAAVLGVVSSFAGALGGAITYSFMLSAFTAFLRFALIKALVYATPLLAVAYLFPAARGAVKFFMNVLAGLVLAGPVAAFLFVGLSNVGGPASYLTSAVAPALAYVAFPIFFSIASGASPGGAAHSLTRLMSGALGGYAGPTQMRGAAAVAGGVAPGGSGGAPGGVLGGGGDAGGTPERGSGGGDYTNVTNSASDVSTIMARVRASRQFVSPNDYESVHGTSVEPSVTPRVTATEGAVGGTVTAEPEFEVTTGTTPTPPTPPPTAGREGAVQDTEGAPSPADHPPQGGSRLGRALRAHNRVIEWYNNSVFKQKIHPKWMSFIEKYGGWASYGHHTVTGQVHPYSYKKMKDEIRIRYGTRAPFTTRAPYEFHQQPFTDDPHYDDFGDGGDDLGYV